MPFISHRASIEIEFRCPVCGETGVEEVEGSSFVNSHFAVDSFNCPECGMILNPSENLDDDEIDGIFDEEDEDNDEDE